MDAFITVERRKTVIISDLKTRVNSSLPNNRQSRASEMQLSIYHQLLSNLINGTINISRVYADLQLDPENCFSDGFLVEAGTTYVDAGILSFDLVLENNNLNVILHLTQLIEETLEHCGNRNI
jgi:hypothetical protein